MTDERLEQIRRIAERDELVSKGNAALERPEKFAEWLQGLPESRVFNPCKATLCPLAGYLEAELGERACVGALNWSIIGKGPGADDREYVGGNLPNWASTYVRLFDDLCEDGTGKDKAYEVYKKLQVAQEPENEEEENKEL